MSKTAELAVYFCQKYPHKTELSKTRLTKLVYLADWKSAQIHQRQITNINWYFNHYGPYVEDVMDAIQNDTRFELKKTSNFYGDSKLEIRLTSDAVIGDELQEEDREILDSVINETSPLYWNAFIKHVYKTDPVQISDKYQKLDLVQIANAQRK